MQPVASKEARKNKNECFMSKTLQGLYKYMQYLRNNLSFFYAEPVIFRFYGYPETDGKTVSVG